MKPDITAKISKALTAIIWRKHARIETEKDKISESGLEDALRKSFTIVEHYPDDPLGASALVLTYVEEIPVHVVLSPRESFCYLITAYIPEEEKWDETCTKRKK